MKSRIILLGALHIAVSTMYLMVTMAIAAILYSQEFFSATPGVFTMRNILLAVLGMFLISIAVPGVIGGISLMNLKTWSKMPVLIIGCLELVIFPIGTLLGIYTIQVVMKDYLIQHPDTSENENKQDKETMIGGGSRLAFSVLSERSEDPDVQENHGALAYCTCQ